MFRSGIDNDLFPAEPADAFERSSDAVRFIFNEDAKRDRGLNSWKEPAEIIRSAVDEPDPRSRPHLEAMRTS